ncbi:MAG: trypsin-like peptidase domain-containing protein [Candidatus Zixiibacteriota bacterium]
MGAKSRYFSIGFIGLLGIIIGVVLTSNFDLTNHSLANQPTGGYPLVVDNDGEYSSPFVSVIENVKDAVVNVEAQQSVKGTYHDDFFWRFFQIPQEPSTSSGSGFFFREDGYVLTNYHVVRDADKISVRTSSGYHYSAIMVGGDPQTDLAVLKVEPEEKINIIPFGNSSKINVGDWAIAIGNPFPQQGLDRTVTVGVISAKGRSNLRFGNDTPRYQDYIQTDASINPGNSGGPLLNLKGEAIGVNAAISSPTGTSVGIGFAIPINLARSIVPDLIASGKVSRGWVGISLADVNEKIARENGLNKVRGVYIQSVVEDSPAQKAGIETGDLLLKFNGEEIIDSDHLSVLISTAPKTGESTIELVRQGETVTVKTEIVDRDEFAKTHNTGQSNQPYAWLGMELLNFTPYIAQQIGSDYFPGVYIYRVERGSRAYRAGILPGSIITQIDNKEVKNLEDLLALMETVRIGKKSIPLLLVDPRGSIEYKAIRP